MRVARNVSCEGRELRYTRNKMRVMGIDCGTEYTGFGVAEQTHGNRDLVYITCGAIKLSKRDPLPLRLAHIFESLCAVARANQPDIVAIEEVFCSVNPKS